MMGRSPDIIIILYRQSRHVGDWTITAATERIPFGAGWKQNWQDDFHARK
jgi:hypothetical protein